MKTIETIALGTIFPKENIDTVLEIVNATPNPRLALDILLGIYKEPVINTVAKIDNRTCNLVNWNKWENQVNYKYETNKKVHIYIDKEVDRTLITADNYKDYKIDSWKEGVTVSHWVALPEMTTETGYTTVEKWLENQLNLI